MTTHTVTSSTAALIALRRWAREVGVSDTTTWRWINRGWLGKPSNIAGKLYLTRDQIDEFNRRAEAGEFRSRPSGAAHRGAKKQCEVLEAEVLSLLTGQTTGITATDVYRKRIVRTADEAHALLNEMVVSGKLTIENVPPPERGGHTVRLYRRPTPCA